MLDFILQYIAAPAVALGITRLFGAAKAAKIRKGARAILGDEQNPTTDITDAVREAWVAANAEVIRAHAAQLAAEHAAGELRIAASVAAAKDAAKDAITSTIVPRDGTEKFSPAWPLKLK